MKKVFTLLGAFVVAVIAFALIFHATPKSAAPAAAVLSVATTTPIVVAPVLSVTPKEIYQGDPFMIQIRGVQSIADIASVTFDSATTSAFAYQGKVMALVGVDLNKKPGNYILKVRLANGQTLQQNIQIKTRTVVDESLGIPETLGGNSMASDNAMVATLVSENATLAHIPTASTTLWTENFTPPLATLYITDPYGYSRQTGAYQIPHKGVDYRAAIGTNVMAINSGVVRLVAEYRDYGNTVVIDHGDGVMSFYLHLSQINVTVGQSVARGQVIALSGETGYAEGPHLHLSVRINGVSIDPVKFLNLFQ